MKNNKETNRKHKEFISRFEPPLYVPASTTVKDSTKSAKGITRGLHKTGVPNSHQSNLYTRGISTQRKYKQQGDKKDHKLLSYNSL